MEIVFYFLGIGLLAASVLLLLDTQQNRRLNAITKDTKNVEPLLLQRAAERKLHALNTFLYGHSAKKNIIPAPAKPVANNHKLQALSAQLNVIVDELNTGKISLQAYNGKLGELLDTTRGVK